MESFVMQGRDLCVILMQRGRQVLPLNRSVLTTSAGAEGEIPGDYGGTIFSDALTQIFSFHETVPFFPTSNDVIADLLRLRK